MPAVRRVSEALALRAVPGLLRDRHFLLALAAGPAFWAGLWLYLGEVPGPAREALGPLLYLVVVTPVLEELAFRGALQGWMLDYTWGRGRSGPFTRANLAVSCLFTAIHFAYHPPLWAIAVIIPSLLFGHLRDRTGSVVPAMLVHAWYNAGYFSLMGVG